MTSCMKKVELLAPAGSPEPIPAPMAPKPIHIPAESRIKIEMVSVSLIVNSSIMATSREKIAEVSAMACPISIFFRISPDLSGDRLMASLAQEAVYPSPTAAPMAPRPIDRPAPSMAATLIHD